MSDEKSSSWSVSDCGRNVNYAVVKMCILHLESAYVIMPIGKNDMVRIHSDATTKPQSCSSGVFIRFGKVEKIR